MWRDVAGVQKNGLGRNKNAHLGQSQQLLRLYVNISCQASGQNLPGALDVR